MPMTSKEMVKFLRKNGFLPIKKSGGGKKGSSHAKFRNEKTKKTVIVPMHAKDLGNGLEKAILKQAGLKKGGKL